MMSHSTSVRGRLGTLRFGGHGPTEEIHLGLQDTEEDTVNQDVSVLHNKVEQSTG